MTEKSIKQGESLRIGFTFNPEYDESRINDLLMYIDGVLIGRKSLGTITKSGYWTVSMSGDDTFLISGHRDLILVIEDSKFGLRKFVVASLLFDRLADEFHANIQNNGYNLILNLLINETVLTSDVFLLDIMKGDKGDPGGGSLPAGGLSGQTLTKLSDTNLNAGWVTPLKLGVTSTDAYYGDKGLLAYNHSTSIHAPIDAQKNINADWNSISGDSLILNKPIIPSIIGLATESFVMNQLSFKADKITGKSLISDTEITRLLGVYNVDISNLATKDSLAITDAIARGKSRATVYNTLADLNTFLSIPANLLTLQLGDNFYIRDLNNTDYWWDGTTKQPLEGEKVDLTNYVQKVTGKSLILDTEIIRLAGVSNVDISNKVDKVVGRSLILDTEITRLLNTLSGTNTGDQIIPTTLPASDVYAWAKTAIKPTYNSTEVGLGNLPNIAFSGSNTGDQILPTLSSLGAVATTDSRLTDSRIASDVLAWAKTVLKPTYTTSEIAEGTNLYYTESRVSANASVVSNNAKVSFPGFGTSHVLSAYGDHLHTGTYQPIGSYEVPLTFSTGLSRTGNIVTNTITQYTDVMARSAQVTASGTVTGLLTSVDFINFNAKVGFPGFGVTANSVWGYSAHPTTISGYGITDAVTGTPWTSVGYLTGITSIQVTTALGFTPANSSSLSSYLPLAGGTLSGQLRFNAGIDIFFGNPIAANYGIGLYYDNSSQLLRFYNGLAGGTLLAIDRTNGAATFSNNLTATGNLSLNSNTNIRTIWGGEFGGAIQILSDNVTANRWVRLGITDSFGAWNGGLQINDDNTATFSSSITATQFIKSGGTSSQFLKADGSVDSTSYLSLAGGTLTGTLALSAIAPFITLSPSGWSSSGYFQMGVNENASAAGTFTNIYYATDKSFSIVRGGIVDFKLITGAATFASTVTATQFIKSGGTSSQFLKADGSVDSTSYLPLTGGTLSGSLTSIGLKVKYTGSGESSSVFPLGNWGATIFNTEDSFDSGGLVVGSRYAANTNIVFQVGGLYNSWNPFFTVNGAGHILIGTTSDNGEKLQVSGNITATKFIKSGGTSSQFLKADGSVDSTSYLPLAGGTLSGNLTAPNFILSSDRRLKTNIKEISTDYIDINYKEFELKSNLGEKRYGVIAQDLQKVAPELVVENEDGLLAVKYIDLLIRKVAELENRIKIMEDK